jgi:hypothetical protein
MIAKCGFNCFECPAYTINVKTEQAKKTCSEGWKKYLNIKIDAEKCECLGCQHPTPWKGKRIIPDKFCIVRKCSVKSGVINCGKCSQYPCEIYIKKRNHENYIEEMRKSIPEEDYIKFLKAYNPIDSEIRLNKINEQENLITPKIKPLKTNLANLSENATQEQKNFYYYIKKIFEAETKTYYEQINFESKKQIFINLLWNFGQYGEIINNKLIIRQKLKTQPKSFSTIIRKKTNSFHSSLEEMLPTLKNKKVDVSLKKLSKEEWEMSLSLNENLEHLFILKEFVLKLIKEYGEPEYIGKSKYKGNAFKAFSKLDFSK